MRSIPLALLFLAPTTAGWAQQNCLEQIKFPQVGRWAQYNAVYQQKEPHTVRYAVIGEEARNGKNLQWVEMRMTGGQKDKNMVYQMLMPGSLTDMNQAQEVVFKAGDRPAMKMSGMMLDMIRNQLDKQSFFTEICKGVSLVGQENVTVAAGRFQAMHFRSEEHAVDSWLSPGVPFSIVKTTSQNLQMELAAHGDGAKSSITEKPQEMRGMGGPSN
jgi:hypothetical protein